MQYNRKAKKMLLDLVNRRRRPGMTQRESDLSNLSGVIYYVGMQNLVFNSLQQALFAVAFDDEDEKERDKVADTAKRYGRFYIIWSWFWWCNNIYS